MNDTTIYAFDQVCNSYNDSLCINEALRNDYSGKGTIRNIQSTMKFTFLHHV